MPTFEDHARSDARPEQVWKLLYDPARFPDWWAGIGTTEVDANRGGYTMYPEGYPDFPMAQLLDTRPDQSGVTISCLVSDLRFEWRLEALDGGRATAISVHVEIPDEEAHRLESQQDLIRRSVARLAELAAAG
jgi:uncharacterized protein YndB with AHSA1/START domain